VTISVRVRGVEWNDALQKLVERSITFAVDRFSRQVGRISVYITDLNGPRGGVDKMCQITADVKAGRPVLILERGADLSSMVHRAARRLGYRIARQTQRHRALVVRRGAVYAHAA